jgi:hypothetical protein
MPTSERRVRNQILVDLHAAIRHSREHAPQTIRDDLIDAYSVSVRLLEKSETLYAFFLEIDTRAQTSNGWRQIGYNDVRANAIRMICGEICCGRDD